MSKFNTPIDYSGCLFIVTAPSGAGKSSLIHALLKRDSNLGLSVSFTTRPPRIGEVNGVHYHFINVTQFESLHNKGNFLESAKVHGNYYATSHTELATQIQTGKDIILEIDWQGARQVRQYFPQAISLFIVPPDIDTLKQRLISRGQDSEEVINQRILNAKIELSQAHTFDYLIINDLFDQAVNAMHAIVKAARQRFNNQLIKHQQLLNNINISHKNIYNN